LKLRDLERHLAQHGARRVGEGAKHTKWRSSGRNPGDDSAPARGDRARTGAGDLQTARHAAASRWGRDARCGAPGRRIDARAGRRPVERRAGASADRRCLVAPVRLADDSARRSSARASWPTARACGLTVADSQTRLLLVTGVPGAGKSCYVRYLETARGYFAFVLEDGVPVHGSISRWRTPGRSGRRASRGELSPRSSLSAPRRSPAG
jgi:hypothetical protein